MLNTQFYAVPDNPWHRGNAMVLVSSASGSDAVTGFIPCVLSKGNYKQRNQKNYIIKFTFDSKRKYWFARMECFIKLRLACDAECQAIKMNILNLSRLGAAQNESNPIGAANANSAIPQAPAPAQQDLDILRFNGALPGMPPMPATQPIVQAPIQQASQQQTHVAMPPPVQNIIAADDGAPQDPFGIHRWTGKYKAPFQPKVIGDFKVFCAVALREFEKANGRLGARALSQKDKMDISESAINKNLRFVQALINKNKSFSTIANLNQSLDEYSREELGFANYAMVSQDKTTKIAGMKVEQIRKLLS